MIRNLIPILLLIAAIGCGGPSPRDGGPGGAPPAPPPAMDSAQRLERTMQDLTKRLELSPDKAEKVRAVIKTGEEKKENMHPEGDRYDSPTEMEKFFARLRQVDRETGEALSKSADRVPVGGIQRISERASPKPYRTQRSGRRAAGRRKAPWRRQAWWKRLGTLARGLFSA